MRFKFRVLLDIEEYGTNACMIDYVRKGCVQRHLT